MTSIAETSAASPLRGIAAMCCGVFIFASVDALAKWMTGLGFHPTQIVMMRYCFGLVPMALALWFTANVTLRTDRPLEHILRGVLMCGALLQFFWGLKYVPLAEAMAVAFTAPLFITALSVPLLKEKVGLHRWAAVVIGFLGMLVILRPGYGTFKPEALLIVAAAFTFALGVVLTRRLTSTESNASIFAYTTLVAIAAMSPLGIAAWKPPDMLEIAMFAMIGLFGGLAHFLLIVAYRHAPAAVNSPFEYTSLIWGTILGWMIWQDVPDTWVWVGAGVIALAGMYITYREAGQDRAGSEEPGAGPH